MRRREFLQITASLLAAPAQAKAQSNRKYRIGYLALSDRVPWITGLIDGLHQLGYVEGQNLEIEWRFAAGNRDLLVDMANDLAKAKLDVVVAPGDFVALLAKKSLAPTPVIAVATHDGVKAGIYDSIPHPGERVTGTESLAPELDAKRIQMLRQLVPSLSRLAVVRNPLDQGVPIHTALIEDAAEKLNIHLTLIDVRSADELPAQLDRIATLNPDGLLSVADPLIIGLRKPIVDFCVAQRLPNAHELRQFVETGALLSYGVSFYALWHRTAYYVQKILTGTKPNDLPVELPAVFDLAVSTRAAKALHIDVPTGILTSADLVVE